MDEAGEPPVRRQAQVLLRASNPLTRVNGPQELWGRCEQGFLLSGIPAAQTDIGCLLQPVKQKGGVRIGHIAEKRTA